MPRSWSSPLGCLFLFPCLAMLTVAAPVSASATDQLTSTSRFGSSLSDFSSRYVDGVGDQTYIILAEGVRPQGQYKPAGGTLQLPVQAESGELKKSGEMKTEEQVEPQKKESGKMKTGGQVEPQKEGKRKGKYNSSVSNTPEY